MMAAVPKQQQAQTKSLQEKSYFFLDRGPGREAVGVILFCLFFYPPCRWQVMAKAKKVPKILDKIFLFGQRN